METQDGWGGGESGPPENSTDGSQAAERDRVRIEFYATYDVMTGVRIAATLGGFFALMVFLIVYKSRSKTVKALNDPKIVEMAEAAVAEEEAVEEERQLTAAIEEALTERARAGVEPPWPRTGRFASYGGGYGSLTSPPRRPARRGASLPGSAFRVAERRSSGTRDRRLSSATGSSSGSDYLERRGSSTACRLSARRGRRRAPLASLGTAGPSFVVECELGSGNDSVFVQDDSTDDEVDQFSTDSGGEAAAAAAVAAATAAASAAAAAAAVVDCTELAGRPLPLPLRLDRNSNSRETLF